MIIAPSANPIHYTPTMVSPGAGPATQLPISELAFYMPKTLGGMMNLSHAVMMPFAGQGGDVFVSDVNARAAQDYFGATVTCGMNHLIKSCPLDPKAPLASQFEKIFTERLLSMRDLSPVDRVNEYIGERIHEVNLTGLVQAGILTHSAVSVYLASMTDAVSLSSRDIPKLRKKADVTGKASNGLAILGALSFAGLLTLGILKACVGAEFSDDAELISFLVLTTGLGGSLIGRAVFHDLQNNANSMRERITVAEEHLSAQLKALND